MRAMQEAAASPSLRAPLHGAGTVPLAAAEPLTTLLVPGWRGPGAGHWQALWAGSLAGVRLLAPDASAHPSRAAWVQAITRELLQAPGPVVLAAHGLGCLAAVQLDAQAARRVHGALLVAPSDPERRAAWTDFSPVPCERLPYRSIVVASTDDPHCPVRRAGAFARSWGSEFVRLQDAGHIDAEAGFGPWPLGLALLRSLE
jgi:predicted alpha/beta hydrolase family esterase